jgi:hypothetical protein
MATSSTHQARPSRKIGDLDHLLRERCPKEHAALPSIGTAPFSRMIARPVGCEPIYGDRVISAIRLKIGTSNGEYTNGLPVYLCIGGEGNNQLALSCDDKIHKFSLDNLICVHLESPFDRLCKKIEDPEIGYEVESKCLRAYACYLFLEAGHVQTVQSYSQFEEYLRLECISLARGTIDTVNDMRQKQLPERQRAETVRECAEGSDRSRCGTVVQGDGDVIKVAPPKVGNRSDRTQEVQTPHVQPLQQKRCMESGAEDATPARKF